MFKLTFPAIRIKLNSVSVASCLELKFVKWISNLFQVDVSFINFFYNIFHIFLFVKLLIFGSCITVSFSLNMVTEVVLA